MPAMAGTSGRISRISRAMTRRKSGPAPTATSRRTAAENAVSIAADIAGVASTVVTRLVAILTPRSVRRRALLRR